MTPCTNIAGAEAAVEGMKNMDDLGVITVKDRPVLLAAIALRCEALVTGDRTDFGAGFGKAFGGVTIYSPAQLAAVALGL